MADAFLRPPLADGRALAVRGDRCFAQQLLEVRRLAVRRQLLFPAGKFNCRRTAAVCGEVRIAGRAR